MSENQEKKITIERRAQVHSFIETDQRSEQEHHNQSSAQVDSQVLTFLDSIFAFFKTTILTSKQNLALLVIFIIYLFSNWSITLSNKKGFSIDIMDILFIVILIYVIKAWFTGEGFEGIYQLITNKTLQVISFAQGHSNNSPQSGESNYGFKHATSTTFQQISKFGSQSFQNVRKQETIEELYERYNQEKFQLSEQSFLDCETVDKLSPQTEEKLKFLVSEYQKSQRQEIPFTVKDISTIEVPSNIKSEEEFKAKILDPYHQEVIQYVKFRFGFDYNVQNPMLKTLPKKPICMDDSLTSLTNDLLDIERELLMNRSLSTYAYSNSKQGQLNNRISCFLNQDTSSNLERFNKRSNQDDFFTESVEMVLGNSDRKEVELKKFVNESKDKKDGNKESLVLADKLIERQAELEKTIKSFKKSAKKNMLDQASQSHPLLLQVISNQENEDEKQQEPVNTDESLKKIDELLTAKINEIVEKSTCTEFNETIYDAYLDNAQEQQMQSESNTQASSGQLETIGQILSNELSIVSEKPTQQALEQQSLHKYLELITKYEYFIDQYKDDSNYLDQIKSSLENYFAKTLKPFHNNKQKRRIRDQLNKYKASLLQEYLIRQYKKQLAQIGEQTNDYKQQLAKLQEQADLKERKVGLLEDQVADLQNKLKEISERLGQVEISYEEEKNSLIRDVDAKNKQIQELNAQINDAKQASSEKEIKEEKKEPEPKEQPVDIAEEMKLRKTTSYQASISILEKSVRGIAEIFYDKFRNTAYFNQQDMMQKLKEKFGDSILDVKELTQDHKDFIIKEFENKFADAEDHFLEKNLGGEDNKNPNQKNQEKKKSIMDSLDKNFGLMKQRLNKARDISDIQQTKITNPQDEKDANRIIDDIINGALTDSDETYNRQLIALKKIMLKYKVLPGNVRGSIDLTKSQKQSNVAAPHQRVRQKIESTIQYIQENMQNIKGQMKTVLSEDMRRTLKSKIAEWKRSQEDKKEVMSKWNLQSQNMWFTLIWHDGNDLDLVVKCPCGQKIYYGTKKCEQCGTYLEIDMNAGGNKNDKFPVEHIYLQKQPKIGSQWEVYCKMFHCNNNKDSPFTIQIEHEDGRIVSYQGTLDINDNPQSPIYKYTVDKGIDEKEKNLILNIKKTIDEQEEFCF